MEDVVRRRVIGTTFKEIRWTIKDGDGQVEDLSSLTPGTAITVQFQEIDRDDQLVGAPLAGAGTFTFLTDGSDGVILYDLDAAEVATVRDLQALVTIDFGGAELEKYPTGYRYILRVVPEFAQAD